MALVDDLAHARSAMIGRVARRVNALEDNGSTLKRIQARTEARLGPGSWARLITCDPTVTTHQIMTFASLLGTTSTWLLTGTHPTTTGETMHDTMEHPGIQHELSQSEHLDVLVESEPPVHDDWTSAHEELDFLTDDELATAAEMAAACPDCRGLGGWEDGPWDARWDETEWVDCDSCGGTGSVADWQPSPERDDQWLY